MRKFTPRLFVILSVIAFASTLSAVATRRANVVFTATIANLPTDAGPVTVWVPIPSTNRDQQINDLTVESDQKWDFGSDKTYGDRYIFTKVDHPTTTVQVVVRFHVDRRTVLFDKLASTDVSQEKLRHYLLADRRVTISPEIRGIAERATRNTKGILEEARSLYDWVASNVHLDRKRAGAGSGDSEGTLEAKSGDCADFHSLFIALARARGIPARFIVGMPIPHQVGISSTTYACWAEFFVQARGWVPVDPADASKTTDPAVQNFLFGNLEFDRVGFSIGRDIVLDPPTHAPLNYFIFPYAEAGGVSVGTPSISLELEPASREKTSHRGR